MVRWTAALAGLTLLAACETDPGGGVRQDTRQAPAVRQVFQEAYQALPFASGAVYVISPDGHEHRMRTYKLVPCRDGERICAGSAHGRAGHVTRGPEFWQVTGAYSGITFYLSPGGDGYLTRGHGALPLAWAADSEQPVAVAAGY